MWPFSGGEELHKLQPRTQIKKPMRLRLMGKVLSFTRNQNTRKYLDSLPKTPNYHTPEIPKQQNSILDVGVNMYVHGRCWPYDPKNLLVWLLVAILSLLSLVYALQILLHQGFFFSFFLVVTIIKKKR